MITVLVSFHFLHRRADSHGMIHTQRYLEKFDQVDFIFFIMPHTHTRARAYP